MTLTCYACGTSFEATQRTARFCSPRCRKRAQRRPALRTTKPADRPAGSGIADAALAELTAAGRAGTAAGAVVLVLARRLDDSYAETGSSVSALSRELRAALAAAMSGTAPAADPLDELRKRRQRKHR